jgi:allantoinase
MRPAPYGPFPYSPIIRRPVLTWPEGARVALWVVPNIEFFSLTEKVPGAAGGSGAPVPDVPGWSARDYGNRVGVFRLMQVLDRHGVRATVALNSELCAQHPAISKRATDVSGNGWATTRAIRAG